MLDPARPFEASPDNAMLSLAEIMKQFPAGHLASWLVLIGKFAVPTNREMDALVPHETFLREIDNMLDKFRDAPLDSALDEMERIRIKLLGGNVRWYDYAHLMESLARRIQYELARNMFMFVPRDKALRLTTGGKGAGNQMGQEVLTRFPDLALDIHHAYSCWALDLSTACVFHLVRIVETGLRELAAVLHLQVKDRPMWNDYLVAIENHVRPPGGGKGTLSREEEIFYSDMVAHIRAISRAWRNPVVHEIAASYENDEATKILNNIEALMQSISAHLPPPTAS
jgi:hypothetical protein